MDPMRCLFALLVGLSLKAQPVPIETVLLAAEWHIGKPWAAGLSPGEEFGIALPFQGETLGYRIRYTDRRNRDWQEVGSPGYSSVTETRVSRRQWMVELLWSPSVEAWPYPRMRPYFALGVGVQQTYAARRSLGMLLNPALPPEGSEWTHAPALSASVGLRFNPWLAVEIRASGGSHTFEKREFQDRAVTASLHVWPLKLCFRDLI